MKKLPPFFCETYPSWTSSLHGMPPSIDRSTRHVLSASMQKLLFFTRDGQKPSSLDVCPLWPIYVATGPRLAASRTSVIRLSRRWRTFVVSPSETNAWALKTSAPIPLPSVCMRRNSDVAPVRRNEIGLLGIKKEWIGTRSRSWTRGRRGWEKLALAGDGSE